MEGTERIVEAVAKYDVDRYVHVSSHSVNPQSPSEFYATKVRTDTTAYTYETGEADNGPGPRRTSGTKHLPGDYARASCTNFRIRGQPSA